MTKNGYYLNLPLGVNYLLGSTFFVTGGYQLSYSLNNLTSDRIGPQWTHSCFLGAGCHFKYFDVDVRYLMQLNNEILYYSNRVVGNEVLENQPEYAGKNNIIKVTAVVPLRWRK